MTKSTADVRVGVDGVIAAGAYGSVAPTSALSTLDVAYTDLGYITDAGVEENTNLTNNDIRAWQLGKLVRNVIKTGTTTWKMTLMQTSAAVLGYYYGGTVAADGTLVVNPGAQRPVFAMILDEIDGTNVVRKYAPSAQITDVGPLKYIGDDASGYEITITALFDDNLGGAFKLFVSPLTAVAAPTIQSAVSAAGQPSPAGTGNSIIITGANFSTLTTAAANVKIGGVNATSYVVVSDSKIVAVLPSAAAGSAPITVTNPTGTSASFPYTRAA